jgi:excisionase family DNA binding protein
MPTIGKVTVYTVTEVGDLLGVTPRTVRAWLRRGIFDATKLGGRWYVSERDLQHHFMTPNWARPLSQQRPAYKPHPRGR